MSAPTVAIYVKDVEKAYQLYQKVFGLNLDYSLEDKGVMNTAVLSKDGDVFCSVLLSDDIVIPKQNIIQLGYSFDTEAALDQAFEQLKIDGEVKMEPQSIDYAPYAASVTDQFGVDWYISVLPDMSEYEG